MTNVTSTPEKKSLRNRLFEGAEKALQDKGWSLARIPRSGKASVRSMLKEGSSKKVSIRTTQDTWVAFPRNEANDGWSTLEDVDFVAVASVDNKDDPKFIQVHLVPGDDMRARFDRAYKARKDAGHVIPQGRGMWVSLYENESPSPVSMIGGGIGLAYPAIYREPITEPLEVEEIRMGSERVQAPAKEQPLTISEAKRRLAETLGVPESAIAITISG